MNEKKVLIIEDDKYIMESIKDLLELEGYLVLCAINGAKALDLLRSLEVERQPDLILLDLMMPVMDGFKFREEQLKDPKLASLPVVIMSADGHVTEKTERIRSKAYIKKPVELDDLISAVQKFTSLN